MFDEFDPGRTLLQGYIARQTAARLKRMLEAAEETSHESAERHALPEALEEDASPALQPAASNNEPDSQRELT